MSENEKIVRHQKLLQNNPIQSMGRIALRPIVPPDNSITKSRYFGSISLTSNAAKASVNLFGKWYQYDAYFGESNAQDKQEIEQDDVLNRKKIILV